MFLIPSQFAQANVIPLLVIIIGLLITIFFLLYRYNWTGKKKKHKKGSEGQRRPDFECPRCGAHVDAKTPVCLECGAEFQDEVYSCPVCGTGVSTHDEECPECSETFVVTEREFECPICHAPVDQHDTECKKCGATFWSAVKRSADYKPEDSEKKNGRIDSSLIEIVGGEED